MITCGDQNISKEIDTTEDGTQANDTKKSNVVTSKDNLTTFYVGHELHIADAEGDYNLHTFNRCTKNPGHTDFVSVDAFRTEHLPKCFREDAFYQIVKRIFDFTVKLEVRMVSSCRPALWEGSPYPCSDWPSKRRLRHGTGSIRSMYMYCNGLNSDKIYHRDCRLACDCKRCQGSMAPSQIWWEIEVMTATHVVFDENEAKRTTCVLFHDRPGCQDIKLDTVHVDYANITTDKCWLRCVTCDKDLVSKFEEMFKNYDQAWTNLYVRYSQLKTMDRTALIVSHPHGCFKHVSVGKWTETQVFYEYQNNSEEQSDDNSNTLSPSRSNSQIPDDGSNGLIASKFPTVAYTLKGPKLTAYYYTTPTCPGTSGATVYLLGIYDGQRYMYSDHHTHIGTAARQDCIGHCGFGFND
ncbi:uncharacterized protein LOC129927399 isoform X1 [Biomphalaria glabrata]|uniref:Uncharacterized protein LOC129927399 isoform X1 n=1 Tax=Biomphalaria glabrata TaxID=6526 RepID=A0A9W3AYI9_BIOGL|nr:uncharacterized protein LOC129927399 isoform X1 [Biomphalaria glabrata]